MSARVGNLAIREGHGRPVCGSCGAISRQSFPVGRDGRLESVPLVLWSLPVGWSVAPYSADFQHRDGTTGDIWTCPACERRLARGESIYRTERRKRQLGMVTA